MTPTTSPYGLWSSPISATALARGIFFSDVQAAADGSLVWLENRSERGVLMAQPADGSAARELGGDFSVRGKVGYGGGEFTVAGGKVYFTEAKSGRLYVQPLAGGAAQPLTPAFGAAASPKLSPDGRWLAYVHTDAGQDCIAVTPADGSAWPARLASGDDFYMQPTWSPDGRSLAWVAWNFPNMPWDGTELRLGRLDFSAGLPRLESVQTIAGGPSEAVFQPEFSPDGRWLAYASDPDGWWQLYLHDLHTGQHRRVTHAEAEHAIPAWIQGMRTFAFDPVGGRLFFLRNTAGFASLWQLDLQTGSETALALDTAYTALDQISAGPGAVPGAARLAMLASAGRLPPRIITVEVPAAAEQTPLPARVVRRATAEDILPEMLSKPEAVTWRGMDGGLVHGIFYPPHHPGFASPGKPPLIVEIHGGPTSQVRAGFSLRDQYFATRGYAVLQVNYRGSTGYGRAYRDLLRGNWGIYDVQDAVSGARALAEAGRVDAGKMVIMGGSAGGFTVLKALQDFPGVFKAGVCLYGVANQFALAMETHKFEAHYSDILLGPLPEAAEIYRERSPIFFVDKINDPLAIFQGEDDTVVPRGQSDELAASLAQRGVPHIYHVYPGEGHGFRKSETIEHFHAALDKFLMQYVIFA